MNLVRVFVSLLLAAFLAPGWAREPVALQQAAIASAHPMATQAGLEMMEQGGNAFDAAVAVSAVLAVVEPFASGIGGGGFWLLHRANDGFETMIDGRETAPAAASRDMYLDANGAPVPGASLRGPRAAGIPGMPAGLVRLAGYGSLPLSTALAPAIRLAEQGFPADRRFLERATEYRERLAADPGAARIFLDQGRPPEEGFVLRQPELAGTLRRLASHGHDGFYRGPVAKKLVRAVRAGGGLWTLQDLEGYRSVEREPVRFFYRGIKVTSAALPSSGGLTLAQALQILEQFDAVEASDPAAAHLVIEAMRLAYQDRARYLGDGDFVWVPAARLGSKRYAAERAGGVDPKRAGTSSSLPEPRPLGGSTTHFSVVDRNGNRVAATLSINTVFGSGFVAGGTGVLLNNEMDDFAIAPGVPNAYGLVGSDANAIAPGKRPLSSMSPTFVEDARGVLVVGTPGGSRIISMVLLAVLEFARGDRDPKRIVSAPRFHHQFLPDVVEVEPGAFDDAWTGRLAAMGHALKTAKGPWGNMQAVYLDKAAGVATAGSDPRGAWY